MSIITGTPDGDVLYDTAEDDTISAGGGDDTIYISNGGVDVVDGGAGLDTLRLNYGALATAITFSFNGSAGAVSTFVGLGTTVRNVEWFDITTGAGNDRLTLGAGNDTLAAGLGTNTVVAGGGDDQIISLGGAVDTVDGGSGIDDWQLQAFNGTALTVTQTAAASFSVSNGSSATSVERIYLQLAEGSVASLGVIGGAASGGVPAYVQFNGSGGTLGLDWSGLSAYATISGNVSQASDLATGQTLALVYGSNVAAMNVKSGSGDDQIYATPGNDTIAAGAGDDSIWAVGGVDQIDGQGGTDRARIDLTAFGGNVSFVLGAAAGAISTFAGQGTTVRGVELFDIATGAGNDSLTLGAGNDTLSAGLGTNTVVAGAGDDLITSLGNAIDAVNGGSGSDEWRLDAYDSGALTVAQTGTGAFSTSNGSSVTSVEWVTLSLAEGSVANLGITGGTDAGGRYSVVYFAGGGGTLGLDWSSLSAAASINGTSNFAYDPVTGETLASLYGSNIAAVNVRTGAGDDYIYGTSGNDTVAAGAGDDTVYAVGGVDQIDGQGGTDRVFIDLSAFAGNVSFTLSGAAGAVSTFAGQGTTVRGIELFDIATGAGNDSLTVGAGDDTLTAGLGTNTIVAGAGNDVITTKGGAVDTVNGGSGADEWRLEAWNSPALTVTQTAPGAFSTSDGSSVTSIERINLVLSEGSTASLGPTGGTAGGGPGYSYVGFGGSGGTMALDWSSLSVSTYVSSGSASASDPGTGEMLAYLIWGNASALSVRTGSDRDQIYGTPGNDTVAAGAGDDTLYAAGGVDQLDGQSGTDRAVIDLSAFAGDVAFTLNSGAGAISTFAGQGSTVRGIEVFDLTTGAGNDSLTLGAGNDTITAGLGTNTIVAGAGDDFISSRGDAVDTINGGSGFDEWRLDAYLTAPETLTQTGAGSFTRSNGSVVTSIERINLFLSDGSVARLGVTGGVTSGGQPAYVGFAGNGTLGLDWSSLSIASVVEASVAYAIDPLEGAYQANVSTSGVTSIDVRTGSGNDQIGATAGNDTLAAGSGDDTVDGRDGADLIDGGSGNDSLVGGEGNDTVQGGAGNDTLDGGTGTDTASYADAAAAVTVTLATAAAQNTQGAGNDVLRALENLTGSAGADRLSGNGGANRLNGGAGNDTLDGGLGNDRLDGESGNDTASYATAAGAVRVDLALGAAQDTGSAGLDTLVSIENLVGGNGNDTLSGDAGANRLDGGAGNDQLDGRDGDDTFTAGGGNDTIEGGAGVDTVRYEFRADAPVWTALGGGRWAVAKPGGTDTLSGVETVRFTNGVLDGATGVFAAATLSVAPSGATAREGQAGATTPVSFTVTRSGDLAASHTASWTVSGADADDFAGGVRPSGTVVFAAGESTRTLTVDVQGDSVVEADETFSLTLSGGSFGVVFGAAQATMTIVNDDAVLSVAASVPLLAEGRSGTTAYAFTVTRAGDTTVAHSVAWRVDGSGPDAAGASDFAPGVLPSGVLTFAAGQAVATVEVGVAGDRAVEADEGFTFTLGAPSAGALLGTATASGVIFNDDNPVRGDDDDNDLVGSEAADGLVGYGGNDTLDGSGGNDRLDGGDGNDELRGGSGNDALFGGAGNDLLDGGTGIDRMAGGMGDDSYRVDDGGDGVTESPGEGIDTVAVSLATYTLGRHLENLHFVGAGAFTGTGNTAANRLQGGAGNDTLFGGGGADTLSGGGGLDVLWGGAGRDSFVFDNAALGGAAAHTVTLQDFSRSAGERIDLRPVDASTLRAGDQAFLFIGEAEFSSTARELRWTAFDTYTLIEGDVDGNGIADLSMVLAGSIAPVDAGWFNL